MGNAHFGVGPSTNSSTGWPGGAARSTATCGFDSGSDARRAVSPACAAVTCFGTRASAALKSALWTLLPGRESEFGAPFRRHAQFLADRVIDFQAQAEPVCQPAVAKRLSGNMTRSL